MDPDELENLINAKTKMIAVCNPNNPTGTYLNKTEVLKLRKKLKDIRYKF